MKFDTERALGLAVRFSFDRRAGTPGERRAADSTAASLCEAGFEVDRMPLLSRTSAVSIRLVASWIALGILFPVGLLEPFSSSVWLRLGGMVLGISARIVVSGIISKFGFFATNAEPEILLTRGRCVIDTPVRVIFVTSLDTPPVILAGRRRRIAALVFVLLSFAVSVVNLFPGLAASLFPQFIHSLLLSFEASLLFWLFCRLNPLLEQGETDNRDGLATLIELARTWPRRIEERVETRFVVAGGHSLDNAGLTELNRVIHEVWPKKPTHVVGLWSPGLGPPFIVAYNGLPSSESGDAALEGLRIPHQYRWTGTIVRTLWPFGSSDPDFVAIFGPTDKAPAAVMTAESMGLAAQLATEIALRWARHASQAAPPPG